MSVHLHHTFHHIRAKGVALRLGSGHSFDLKNWNRQTGKQVNRYVLPSILYPTEHASKTLSCRLSLGLLTNIFIFFLGKIFPVCLPRNNQLTHNLVYISSIVLTLIISNSSVNAVIAYFGSFLNKQVKQHTYFSYNIQLYCTFHVQEQWYACYTNCLHQSP